jgi:hypothetical protein
VCAAHTWRSSSRAASISLTKCLSFWRNAFSNAPLRQYLYFCTSKASKSRTFSNAARRTSSALTAAYASSASPSSSPNTSTARVNGSDAIAASLPSLPSPTPPSWAASGKAPAKLCARSRDTSSCHLSASLYVPYGEALTWLLPHYTCSASLYVPSALTIRALSPHYTCLECVCARSRGRCDWWVLGVRC